MSEIDKLDTIRNGVRPDFTPMDLMVEQIEKSTDSTQCLRMLVNSWVTAYGTIRGAKVDDHFIEDCTAVSFTTGGWSDNEMLINSFMHNWYHGWWESSHRGGLHVLHVPTEIWESLEYAPEP